MDADHKLERRDADELQERTATNGRMALFQTAVAEAKRLHIGRCEAALMLIEDAERRGLNWF